MAPFLAVGIRSFSGNKLEKKYDKSIIRPGQMRSDFGIFEKKLTHLGENVYITIDLDAFDPSVMPAVGTPEPGGLTWDETMMIPKKMASTSAVRTGRISPR